MNGLVMITDNSRSITYTKGKLLGKGGFAMCYEFITRDSSKQIFAAKCITKESTKSPSTSAKLKEEISVHKSLNHEHIVKMHNYFQDRLNVYILLEICENKSLYEMHKRRKQLTEPETRYLSRQIARGCEYIHLQKIIHRDLKLANILLDSNMNVKIADFGLAGIVNQNGDKRITMCGTPNYIAPEILTKSGHSYEADVWSLGCIIYTLVVGKPPFETEHVQTTYEKIKRSDYRIPAIFHASTNEIIAATLIVEARKRPSMTKLLEITFFKEFIPQSLPKGALTTEPKFNIPQHGVANDLQCVVGNAIIPSESKTSINHLLSLKEQIAELLESKKIINSGEGIFKSMEKSENPKLAPIYWISKWVDYTDRFGLGYQLSNECTGVYFNDREKMIQLKNTNKIQYVDSDDKEIILQDNNYSPSLKKKLILLENFKRYMYDNLATAGEKMAKIEDSAAIGRLPYLQIHHRTDISITMFLCNGTFQINFVRDHIKIILCPVMKALSYIDEQQNFATFSIDLLTQNGCTEDLYNRLNCAYAECKVLISRMKNGN